MPERRRNEGPRVFFFWGGGALCLTLVLFLITFRNFVRPAIAKNKY